MLNQDGVNLITKEKFSSYSSDTDTYLDGSMEIKLEASI
jgi:hypothetical protein